VKCQHKSCAHRGQNGYESNVDLVTRIKNCSPIEAVRLLGGQFGFDVPEERPICGATTRNSKTCAATELESDGRCKYHTTVRKTNGAPGNAEINTGLTDNKPESNAISVRAGANPPDPAPPLMTTAERALLVGGGERIATEIPTLDANTRGGFRNKKRVVYGGAPGAGKTTLLTHQAWRWSMEGHAVTILASDEEAEDVLVRIGQINGLCREDLERGDDHTRQSLARIVEGNPNFDLIDGDEDEVTIERASEMLKARRQPGQFSILCVDSIQAARVVNGASAQTDKQRVDMVMRALKIAGKVDGHLVIATCELNRGGYRSQNPAERVDDLAAFKESGSVEYGATLALVMREVKDSGGLVSVAIAKNRMGKKVPFRLQIDFKTATMKEVAIPEAAAEEAVASPLQQVKEKVVGIIQKSIQPITSAAELARRAKQAKGTVLKAVKELVEDGRLVKREGAFIAVLGAVPADA
jgi:hypothetical protein